MSFSFSHFPWQIFLLEGGETIAEFFVWRGANHCRNFRLARRETTPARSSGISPGSFRGFVFYVVFACFVWYIINFLGVMSRAYTQNFSDTCQHDKDQICEKFCCYDQKQQFIKFRNLLFLFIFVAARKVVKIFSNNISIYH